jgi:ComF family protein
MSPPLRSTVLRAAADGLLAVLLAPCCAACRRPLESPTGGPVCPPCWSAVLPITPPICDSCGDPLPSWRVTSVELSRCPRCRRGGRAVDRGRAFGVYDGRLRDILHAFKYERRRSLATRLGRLMADAGRDLLEGSSLVVPVPLHRRRERSRGFNQARDLAVRLGPPVADVLQRTRATPSQTDLPAARRHANVRDAFVVGPRSCIEGAVVVLVDDVSTTGATLEACARALKEAGAREVRALTAARVGRRRP